MGFLSGPRQAVLITSRAKVKILGKEVEKDDVMTASWHMPVSFEPPLYAVSVGKARFSHMLISSGKCFVVNFAPVGMKEAAVLCGRKSGEHTDKFADAMLGRENAKSVECPRVKGAEGYIECEVINEVEAGDHTIFIGKVLNWEMPKKSRKLLFHAGESSFTTTQGKEV